MEVTPSAAPLDRKAVFAQTMFMLSLAFYLQNVFVSILGCLWLVSSLLKRRFAWPRYFAYIAIVWLLDMLAKHLPGG